MAFRFTPGIAAVVLSIPGILAFIFGVVAENKKPDPQVAPGLLYDQVSNETSCYYPNDPTLPLGILSVIFLFISALLSLAAITYPYNGKSVSTGALFRSTSLVVFAVFSMIIFLMAEALLLWAIIDEFRHRNHNVHGGQLQDCPTAKSGLFGGAGFLALDATLFFLISLMLTTNARSDYFDESEDDSKGSYGEVTTYPPPNVHTADRV
jgi:hypothetical protein